MQGSRAKRWGWWVCGIVLVLSSVRGWYNLTWQQVSQQQSAIAVAGSQPPPLSPPLSPSLPLSPSPPLSPSLYTECHWRIQQPEWGGVSALDTRPHPKICCVCGNHANHGHCLADHRQASGQPPSL